MLVMKRYLLQTSATYQVIAISVMIWLLILLAQMVGDASAVTHFVLEYLALPADVDAFVFRPWTLITHSFVHVHTGHLLVNLLGLYAFGVLFEAQVGRKRWWWIYTIGMVMGAIFYWLSIQWYPYVNHYLVGHSASTMGIVGAMVAWDRKRKVNLWGVVILEVFWLALIFLVIDLIGVRQGWNVGGHFAHWGGLLAGFVAMKIWSNSDSDVVQYNHRRPKTDEQFNTERLHREEKLNAILDKIGRSGFDSLTQSEKNFLEEQSKK
jgi:membrane associated rhomboid family serine protease